MFIRAVERIMIGIIVAFICALIMMIIKLVFEARANDIAEMRYNAGLCQTSGCAFRARLLGYETPEQHALRTQPK